MSESRSAEVDERNHCSEHNSKDGRSSAGTRIAVDVIVWVRSPFAARLVIFRKNFEHRNPEWSTYAPGCSAGVKGDEWMVGEKAARIAR